MIVRCNYRHHTFSVGADHNFNSNYYIFRQSYVPVQVQESLIPTVESTLEFNVHFTRGCQTSVLF